MQMTEPAAQLSPSTLPALNFLNFPKMFSIREQLCFESVYNLLLNKKCKCCGCCGAARRLGLAQTTSPHPSQPSARYLGQAQATPPGLRSLSHKTKNAVICSQIKCRATGHKKDGLMWCDFIHWIFLPPPSTVKVKAINKTLGH